MAENDSAPGEVDPGRESQSNGIDAGQSTRAGDTGLPLRWEWYRAVRAMPSTGPGALTSHAAKVLASALAEFMPDDASSVDELVCWPSRRLLCDRIGERHVRSFERVLDTLAEVGVVEVVGCHRCGEGVDCPGGRGHSNEYRAVMPTTERPHNAAVSPDRPDDKGPHNAAVPSDEDDRNGRAHAAVSSDEKRPRESTETAAREHRNGRIMRPEAGSEEAGTEEAASRRAREDNPPDDDHAGRVIDRVLEARGWGAVDPKYADRIGRGVADWIARGWSEPGRLADHLIAETANANGPGLLAHVLEEQYQDPPAGTPSTFFETRKLQDGSPASPPRVAAAPRACRPCSGSGRTVVMVDGIHGRPESVGVACSTCRGTGEAPPDPDRVDPDAAQVVDLTRHAGAGGS